MPRKTHEEIAAAKEAKRQLKLKQQREQAADTYRGG